MKYCEKQNLLTATHKRIMSVWGFFFKKMRLKLVDGNPTLDGFDEWIGGWHIIHILEP